MPQGRAGLVEWCCVWPFFATSCCKDRKKIVIVLLGLDASGKSTLLAKLRKEKFSAILPTCGFSCKTWKIQDFSVSVFDLGGRKGIRYIWPHYFAEAYGAIFVVDSIDRGRFFEAKEELQNAVNNTYLLGKPILVVANKQGPASAMRFEEIKSSLRPMEISHNLAQCKCDLQEGDAVDPDFHEGLHWLLESIGLQYEELRKRVDKDATSQKAREGNERAERQERIKIIKSPPAKPHLPSKSEDTRAPLPASEEPTVSTQVLKETMLENPVVDLLSELNTGKELEYGFASKSLLLPGQVMQQEKPEFF